MNKQPLIWMASSSLNGGNVGVSGRSPASNPKRRLSTN